MKTNTTCAAIVILTLLLSACGANATPTAIVPNTGTDPESIGIISAEQTLVESGTSENLLQVTSTEDFFNHYTVRVTNGGTAKLDFFVNQISLRLFNDTAVGNVRADPSGTPDRAVRMKLVFGGLSGEVTKNGVPVQFELTNGVNIYILGTQFLVLYDPETNTTYIGNFDGTVAYTTPAQPSVQFIQAGQLYELSPSFETKATVLNFNRADLETRTLTRRVRLLETLRNFLEPTATPTAMQTATPTTTLTASPTATITATPTRIIPCNRAAFVSDVTIPDGTSFSPGFQFTKVWRLRNAGTCTWTTGYSLVFQRGEQMGARPSVSLPSTVPPGQTVDVEVGLVAPSLPGSYQGDWMLMSSSGVLFGAGAGGTTPVWVKINVKGLPNLTVSITGEPAPDCSGSVPVPTQGGTPTPMPSRCTTTIEFIVSSTNAVAVASSFEVLIEVNDIQPRTVTVNDLPAGASQDISVVLDGFCYNPDCTVRVTVDSTNVVPESDEADNVSEEMFNG